MCADKIDGTALRGVPATALWTLRNRAVEALRPDSTYEDPESVRLYETIDYPYDDFGGPSQTHPLRALTFDNAIRDFRAEHPDGVVVALGEGLQTSFWRLADPAVRWVSVDLPEMIALRERLLPAEPHLTHVAASALDRSWFDAVEPGTPTFLSAEGLFMYFERADVLSLIADCAARFPGGRLLFDSIPAWFSKKTLSGMKLAKNSDYQAPPMPFHLSVAEAARLAGEIPGVASATDVDLAPGRGLWGSPLLSFFSHAPVLKNYRPCLTLLRFAN